MNWLDQRLDTKQEIVFEVTIEAFGDGGVPTEDEVQETLAGHLQDRARGDLDFGAITVRQL